MGMVKWTGEGFKIIGQILTNETVKEWLREHGKEIVLSLLEKTTARWFLGDLRAKRKARKTVLREVNASKPLRMALNDSLNKLPSIIQGLGRYIITDKIEVLTKEKSFRETLVVIPRALVIDGFASTLIKDLGQAAELKRYQALPEVFLRDQAKHAERVFLDSFSKNSHPVVVSASGIVLGVDNRFDWHLRAIPGHYYFGHIDSISTDLTKRSDRKEFIKDIQLVLEEKMIQLGKLTPDEIDDTCQHFFNKE